MLAEFYIYEKAPQNLKHLGACQSHYKCKCLLVSGLVLNCITVSWTERSIMVEIRGCFCRFLIEASG